MIFSTKENNRGKLLVVAVAVLSLVACVAIMFDSNEVQAATNEQGYYGNLDAYQSFPLGTNVVIEQNTTIEQNGVLYVQGDFRVAPNVTLTIEDGGQLIIAGNDAKVLIEGDVVVDGSGTNNYISDSDGEPISTGTPAESTKVRASAITIEDASADGIMPNFDDSGVVITGSVTVTKGGAFNAVSGSILIINGGILDITKSGSNVGTISGVTVYIATGGTFDFNGRATGNVDVVAYGSGTVFTSGSARIIPTTNNINSVRTTSDLTFTNTYTNYTGYYLDGNDVETQNIRQYALTVSGTVANMDTLYIQGKTYQTDSSSGEVTIANASTYFTPEAAAKHNDSTLYYNDRVNGKILVSDTLTFDDTAVLALDNTGYIAVEGTLSISETTQRDQNSAIGTEGGSNEEIVGTVRLSGTIEVAGTLTMNAQSFATETARVGTIAINGGSATIADFEDYPDSQFIYGAYYIDEDEVGHLGTLSAVIAAASAASVDDVYVYGTSGSENATGNTDGYGSYVISSDVTVPADMTLNIGYGLIINDGATMTFALDSYVDMDDGWVYVDGKLVDISLEFESYEKTNMTFEVKSVSEDELTNTYCSLATALRETSSGTIYLYDNVTIDGTMTIGENVTVQYAEDRDLATGKQNAKISFYDKDATLVVNGVLYLTGSHDITRTVDGTTTGEQGTVTVNNMIVFDKNELPSYATYQIPGVYFGTADIGAYEEAYYIASAATAAENSSVVSGTMIVYGPIAMGTVTFTEGEDNDLVVRLVNNGTTQVTTGTVTLVGGVEFYTRYCTSVSDDTYEYGMFTGTVTSETSNGTSTVSFTRMIGANVYVGSSENADGSTTTFMVITGDNTNDPDDSEVPRVTYGSTAITAGTFYTSGETTLSNLVIDENATLIVPEGSILYVPNDLSKTGNTIPKAFPYYTEQNIERIYALIVDGTLTLEDDGALYADNSIINGAVNASGDSTTKFDIMYVNGTVASEGTVSTDIGIVNGTISGDYIFSAVFVVMAGAGTTDVDIFLGQTDVAPEETTYFVNGSEYATMYAPSIAPVDMIMLFIDLPDLSMNTAKFYSDEAMANSIYGIDIATSAAEFAALTSFTTSNIIGVFNENYFVGDFQNVYIGIEASRVTGTISAGTGLDLYVDNIKWDISHPDYNRGLTVGQHTVSFDVRAGYDGTNAIITFNGQTVQNGGTITITEAGFTILASGAVPSSGQTITVDGGNGDSGMGLTDYLLIILVILIVVMAIMVAMRLMRS